LALGLTAVVLRPGDGATTSGASGTLPAGWPSTLQLGAGDAPGGAAALRSVAPFGFRYQYLAGGVNTGNGWSNWNADGQFATYYIEDSVGNGIVPVFTYYQIYQSAPGNSQGEADGVAANLQNAQTMAAYFSDLKLFFQRAAAFPGNTVVLHVEPDMWGYIQQRGGDNAGNFSARVASTGLTELAGLPETAAGVAQAIVRLRDTYAPNVLLGYHLSIWGTGIDIQWSKPGTAETDALAQRAGAFYNSLGANFDVSFAEFSDRDAGFKQAIYGDGGASWFAPADFDRHARFLSTFSAATQKRVVLWQIPLGNTKMRAMDNTWNHYQDNRVEWLLDDTTRGHLQTYINAGVVAFLFGRGADGATCACDANGDGVTNPAAINGNTLVSLNGDDDGGFFKQKAAAYYAQGAMALTSASVPPTPTIAAATSTPTRTPTPVAPTVPATATRTPTTAPPTATPTRSVTAPTATPTRTPTVTAPTATPTAPPAAAAWTASGSASPASLRRGQTVTLRAIVGSSTDASALVDIEVYNASGVKVYQQFWDAQTFSAGSPRTFTATWRLPTFAAKGTYRVKVGVFGAGWTSLYSWNDGAASFTVR